MPAKSMCNCELLSCQSSEKLGIILIYRLLKESWVHLSSYPERPLPLISGQHFYGQSRRGSSLKWLCSGYRGPRKDI